MFYGVKYAMGSKYQMRFGLVRFPAFLKPDGCRLLDRRQLRLRRRPCACLLVSMETRRLSVERAHFAQVYPWQLHSSGDRQHPKMDIASSDSGARVSYASSYHDEYPPTNVIDK